MERKDSVGDLLEKAKKKELRKSKQKKEKDRPFTFEDEADKYTQTKEEILSSRSFVREGL